MANYFKRIMAAMLAVVMCVTTLNLSVFAAENENMFAIDKTATKLDENDNTDVTLTVGGVSDGDIDVVILLGGGMQGNQETVDSAINVFKDVIENPNNKSKIKLGLISLEKGQEIIAELTELKADTYKQFITEKFAYINSLPAGTTNLHSQLKEAKRMLDADTSVRPENKYMFVIATGRTYWYDDANGNQATIVGKYVSNVDGTAGVGGKGTFYTYGNYIWQSQRSSNTTLYMIPDKYNNSYSDYYDAYKVWVENDKLAGDNYTFAPLFDTSDISAYANWQAANNKEWRDLYNKSKGGRYGLIIRDPAPVASNFPSGNGVNGLTSADVAAGHAINYERAQYESIKVYQAMVDAGYNCYALCSETVHYQNDSDYIDTCSSPYSGKSRAQLGHSFMNYLATLGGQTEAPALWKFKLDENGEKIANYHPTAGYVRAYEEVLDENFFAPIAADIAHKLDAGTTVVDYIGDNENGNFDFIEDASGIYLTINGVKYPAEKLETARTLEEHGQATSSYSIKDGKHYVDYFADSAEGANDEHFVWTFNESVPQYSKVCLTYKLHLDEKSGTETGIYTVPTNNSATIYPVDTEGNEGDPEVFPLPEVDYFVYDLVIDKAVSNNSNVADGTKFWFEVTTTEGEETTVVDVVEVEINDGVGTATVNNLPKGTYHVKEVIKVDEEYLDIATWEETTGETYEYKINYGKEGVDVNLIGEETEVVVKFVNSYVIDFTVTKTVEAEEGAEYDADYEYGFELIFSFNAEVAEEDIEAAQEAKTAAEEVLTEKNEALAAAQAAYEEAMAKVTELETAIADYTAKIEAAEEALTEATAELTAAEADLAAAQAIVEAGDPEDVDPVEGERPADFTEEVPVEPDTTDMDEEAKAAAEADYAAALEAYNTKKTEAENAQKAYDDQVAAYAAFVEAQAKFDEASAALEGLETAKNEAEAAKTAATTERDTIKAENEALIADAEEAKAAAIVEANEVNLAEEKFEAIETAALEVTAAEEVLAAAEEALRALLAVNDPAYRLPEEVPTVDAAEFFGVEGKTYEEITNDYGTVVGYRFALKHGEGITFSGMEENTKYVVTEINDGGADKTTVDGIETKSVEGLVYSVNEEGETVTGTVLNFFNVFEAEEELPPPTDPEDPTDPIDPPYVPEDPEDPTDPVDPVDPVDPEEEEEIIIEEPEVPLAPADPAEGDEEIEEEIIEEDIPLADLPKTGGATGIGFCIVGLGSIAAGTMLKRKDEDEE